MKTETPYKYSRTELIQWLGLVYISPDSVLQALAPFLLDEDYISIIFDNSGQYAAIQYYEHPDDDDIAELTAVSNNLIDAICNLAHQYMWEIKCKSAPGQH